MEEYVERRYPKLYLINGEIAKEKAIIRLTRIIMMYHNRGYNLGNMVGEK